MKRDVESRLQLYDNGICKVHVDKFSELGNEQTETVYLIEIIPVLIKLS